MPALLTERLLSFAEAAASQVVNGKGRAVSVKAIYFWASTGLLDHAGLRVVLESAWVGGRRVTSVEALERFAEKRNRGRGAIDRTPAQRNKAAEQAKERLRQEFAKV